MTVEMLSSTAAGTGVLGPEDMLHQLDELMALPGAQGHHYLVVRQLLVEGRSIQNCSFDRRQLEFPLGDDYSSRCVVVGCTSARGFCEALV